MDQELRLDDLGEIFEKMYDARPKWYEIGLQLKINAIKLDSIKSDNRNECKDCFREMIKEWLITKSPCVTWRSLVNTLVTHTVDYPRLAEDLEQQLCQGSQANERPTDDEHLQSKLLECDLQI